MTTTIITGASSGMGLFAAVELAGRGHRVIGTMRNAASAGRLNEAATAAGVTVEVRELDVTAPDAAERVAAIEGRPRTQPVPSRRCRSPIWTVPGCPG